VPDFGAAGAVTFGAIARSMLAHASPSFLRQHMPKIFSGEEIWCQFYSPFRALDLASPMLGYSRLRARTAGPAPGSGRPKQAKMALSQKTSHTRNGIGIEATLCSNNNPRVCPKPSLALGAGGPNPMKLTGDRTPEQIARFLRLGPVVSQHTVE
jgi:hypothetical protein